jgi:hypothetical protein
VKSSTGLGPYPGVGLILAVSCLLEKRPAARIIVREQIQGNEPGSGANVGGNLKQM